MSAPKSRNVAESIAGALQAMRNCEKTGNDRWLVRHRERIEKLVSGYLPRGSGFDNGTQFDFERSRPDRLVFNTAFHHMNDGGYYDGWTEHTVTVTPSLVCGFELRIGGRDRREIKDYIGDSFELALSLMPPDDYGYSVAPDSAESAAESAS